MKINIIIAMTSEAKYLINYLKLEELKNNYGLRHFYRKIDNHQINLFFQEKTNNFEKIGTVQAALLTYKSLQIERPDLVLNIGTCGAIENSELCILDIVSSKDFVIYHDRFTIDSLENYSVGKYPCEPQNLFKNAIPSIFGTSNTLIINKNNIETIKKYKVTCLDMEAAAVAEVCQEEKIKFFALKVFTDMVYLTNNGIDTESQFVKNFRPAMEKISEYINKELKH